MDDEGRVVAVAVGADTGKGGRREDNGGTRVKTGNAAVAFDASSDGDSVAQSRLRHNRANAGKNRGRNISGNGARDIEGQESSTSERERKGRQSRSVAGKMNYYSGDTPDRNEATKADRVSKVSVESDGSKNRQLFQTGKPTMAVAANVITGLNQSPAEHVNSKGKNHKMVNRGLSDHGNNEIPGDEHNDRDTTEDMADDMQVR